MDLIISEIDRVVNDIGFPENGLYIFQAHAGDGKTILLVKLMEKYLKQFDDTHYVKFLYSEYNVADLPVARLTNIEDHSNIYYQYIPLSQTSIRTIGALKERIDNYEYQCNRKKDTLAAVFFDDFDSWFATHSRFQHGTNLYEQIQKACAEMREYAITKPFPIFVTMMMQRDSKCERLGTSITYTRNI